MRLRDLYGVTTPIAINHKFDECPLDATAFPADVPWVRQHITTGWGAWATVEAALAALRLLARSAISLSVQIRMLRPLSDNRQPAASGGVTRKGSAVPARRGTVSLKRT
jgi:hypothetical protein